MIKYKKNMKKERKKRGEKLVTEKEAYIKSLLKV